MSLHQMYLQAAAASPRNTAIVYDNGAECVRVPYNQLLAASEAVANELRRMACAFGWPGDMTQDPVGVFFRDASATSIASILGIMLSGRPFLPLTADDWREGASFSTRLGLLVILTDAKPADDNDTFHPPGTTIDLSTIGQETQIAATTDIKTGNLPPCWPILRLFNSFQRNQFIESSTASSSPMSTLASLPYAYFIRSSGTISKVPSVIKVPHASIVPNIVCLRERLEVTAGDVFFLASSFTFDPFVVELFLALSSSASIVVVPQSVKLDSRRLADVLFARNRITLLLCTPSLFFRFSLSQLHDWIFSLSSSCTRLVLGGESPVQLRSLRPMWQCVKDHIKVFNIYGITEVSCWASLHRLQPDDPDEMAFDNIGEALQETSFEVLDEHGDPIVNGEGELLIVSKSRLCVVGDETQPVLSRRTGDIVTVSCSQSGSHVLHWKCRKGNIIKHNGSLINLDEAAQLALNSLPGVELCRFRICIDADQASYNVMFYKDSKHAYSIAEIITHLSQALPARYLPDTIHAFEREPLTENGKLDTAALEIEWHSQRVRYKTQMTDRVTELDATAINDLELFYDGLVRDVLALKDSFDRSLTFIELGGSSNMAVLVSEALREWLHNKGLSSFIPKFDVTIIELLLRVPLFEVCDRLLRSNSQDLQHAFQAKRAKSSENTDLTVAATPIQDNSGNLCCFSNRSDVYRKIDGQPCSIHNRSMNNSDFTSCDVKWRYNLGKCIDASPLCVCYLAQDKPQCSVLVFIGSHSHVFACIDGETGAERWVTALPDRIESSAAVSRDGRKVYVGCYDGGLYCLNASSGAIISVFSTEDCIKCSPAIDHAQNRLYCGSHDGYLYCVHPDSMSLRWRYAMDDGHPKSALFASPLLNNDHQRIIFATLSGIVSCITASEGVLVWSVRLGGAVFSSPVFSSDSGAVCIGCTNNMLYCISEGVIMWTYATSGPVFASPSCARSSNGEQVIIFGSHDGCLRALDMQGRLRWSIHAESEVAGRVCIQHNVGVCCTTSGKVFMFDISSGLVLRNMQLPGLIYSSASPAPTFNGFIVGCRDNHVFGVRWD